MSGPQGSDPMQPWHAPGQGDDRSSEPTMAGSPWQQQPPPQDATWQIPAYTPAEYSQYQQPAQYPQSTPGYGQTDFNAQTTQFGFGQYGQYAPQLPYGQPGQYGQYAQQPPYGQPGQYAQPYEQATRSSKRSMVVIGGVVGVVAVLFIGAILVLGFWEPGFLVTTKLDVNKAQAGVQQILTDETNGYGAKNVKDVKCNHGANPTVQKGASFDCDVSIDGAPKHVTVTFQDSKGTYEVGRPQ